MAFFSGYCFGFIQNTNTPRFPVRGQISGFAIFIRILRACRARAVVCCGTYERGGRIVSACAGKERVIFLFDLCTRAVFQSSA